MERTCWKGGSLKCVCFSQLTVIEIIDSHCSSIFLRRKKKNKKKQSNDLTLFDDVHKKLKIYHYTMVNTEWIINYLKSVNDFVKELHFSCWWLRWKWRYLQVVSKCKTRQRIATHTNTHTHTIMITNMLFGSWPSTA